MWSVSCAAATAVAEGDHLGLVGHVGQVGRDPDAVGRVGQASSSVSASVLLGHVARGHVAALGRQLAHELAAHAAAAAGHHGDASLEALHRRRPPGRSDAPVGVRHDQSQAGGRPTSMLRPIRPHQAARRRRSGQDRTADWPRTSEPDRRLRWSRVAGARRSVATGGGDGVGPQVDHAGALAEVLGQGVQVDGDLRRLGPGRLGVGLEVTGRGLGPLELAGGAFEDLGAGVTGGQGVGQVLGRVLAEGPILLAGDLERLGRLLELLGRRGPLLLDLGLGLGQLLAGLGLGRLDDAAGVGLGLGGGWPGRCSAASVRTRSEVSWAWRSTAAISLPSASNWSVLVRRRRSTPCGLAGSAAVAEIGRRRLGRAPVGRSCASAQ